MRERLRERVRERLLDRADVARQLQDLQARGVEREGLLQHLRFLYVAGRLAPGVAGDWEHALSRSDVRALGPDPGSGMAWYEAPAGSRLTDATGGALTTAGAALVAPGRLTPEVRAHETAHARRHDPAQVYAYAGSADHAAEEREARGLEKGPMARLPWWHGLAPDVQARIEALWEQDVIWKADWNRAVEGLTAPEQRAELKAALSERFTFEDQDMVERQERIGVDPASLTFGRRARGYLASAGVMKQTTDAAMAAKGIIRMGEASIELTTALLSGGGVVGQAGKVAAQRKDAKTIEIVISLAQQLVSGLKIVAPLTDGQARDRVETLAQMLSSVAGKLSLGKNIADAANGADIARAMAIALQLFQQALTVARELKSATAAVGSHEGSDADSALFGPLVDKLVNDALRTAANVLADEHE